MACVANVPDLLVWALDGGVRSDPCHAKLDLLREKKTC